MKLVINDITPDDYQEWFKLWIANNDGKCAAPVTAKTWQNLLDPASAIHGLVARLDDNIVGLVHYVLHPVTGNTEPAAYMEDLYIDPSYRRRGIGRALVRRLAALGKQNGWARLYWLAEQKNAVAQAFYAKLGVRIDFSVHVLPLT